MTQKVVLSITGASGAIYARLLIEQLLQLHQQCSAIGVVMSKNAQTVWQTELGNDAYKTYPVQFFDKYDFTAPFASGSSKYSTMIIAPCSMGTMGRIAAGTSDDLITRAADVMLKERRKLILVPRETPYSLIHIRNMETITLAGGIICPASPSFYSNPGSIDEVANTVVHRILDLAGFDIGSFRWGA